MTIESLIIWLVIGGIAGWLAGLIVNGNSQPAMTAPIMPTTMLPLIGFVLVGGILAEIFNAVIGAVILLLVIGLFKKAT